MLTQFYSAYIWCEYFDSVNFCRPVHTGHIRGASSHRRPGSVRSVLNGTNTYILLGLNREKQLTRGGM